MNKLATLRSAMTLGTLALLGLAPAAHAQLTFNVNFYGDLTGTPPPLGTGTVTFASDPGNGTFAYNSLSSPTLSFTFPGDTFTNADINSDLSRVQVIIAPADNGQRSLVFSDTGGGAGGAFSGSLDFNNADGFLTFSPSYVPFVAYQEATSANSAFGFYTALAPAATPEPGSVALLIGMTTIGAGVLHKSRK